MDKAIFLCGFMGAGKSSVGRALARALKCPLLDTDRLIEEGHGPIPKIFEEKGEAHFRQLEAQLAQKLREEENVVISTGGGFVLSEAVQEALKGCQVVYLDVPFEICWKRIRFSDRPLVRSNSKKQLMELYKKRVQIYKAISTVQVKNHRDLKRTVTEIMELCK